MLEEATPIEESSEEPSLRDQILTAKAEIESVEESNAPVEVVREEAKADDKVVDTEANKEPAKVDSSIPAPTSWKSEAKEKWGDIPDEAKKYIAQREAEMHRAITAQDDLKTAGKAIRELVQPYQDLFAEMPDIKPPALIRGYLETEKTLRRGTPEQKAALIGNVIKAYGLDVNLLNAALQGQIQATRPDPRVETLEQRIARFEELEQQRAESEKLSAIEKFMVDNAIDEDFITDEFLNEVKIVRATSPQLSERQALDQALERYRWLSPSLRESMLKSQHKDASKQDALNRARKAGSSVVGSPGLGADIDKPATDLRAELERQFSRVGRL